MSTFPIFKTFQRVGSFPITDTEVFDTIEDLQDYALNNPTAYAGQQCAVKGNPSTLYVVNSNRTVTLQGSGGSGGSSTPETATSIGSLINSSSSKGIPVDGDMFAIRDSVTGLLQKIPFLALKGTLKTYFDQFYSYVFKTINGHSIIGNGDITISGGGTSTPETSTSIGALINSSTDKSAPVDGDMFAIRDSVTGFLQKVSFSNLKKVFKDYFDTLYNNYTHPTNHPASIITQDTNNRLVSDTEKATWNSKSNFSGAYNDLSGKPSFKTINGNSITGTGNIEIEGSGGTSTPETATSMGVLINTATDKTTPVDADMFSIRDSVSGFLQKISLSNLKSVLKTYFDTLYNNYTHPANHPASVITQDANNRFVTDTQLSNIPKNSNSFINFSDTNITIDCRDTDVFIDNNFEANITLTAGNKTITIINPQVNKVVSLLFPKVSETTVIILPEACKKLHGDYSDTLQNVVMIHCVSTSPLIYLYAISQIQ